MLATVTALLVASPIAAWAAAPSAATPSVETPQPTLTLAPLGDGVTTVGGAASVAIALDNPTDTTVEASVVQVTASATPLATHAELEAWLTGDAGDASGVDGANRAGEVVAAAALSAVSANDRTTATVPLDNAFVSSLGAGVYPLRAEYAAGGQTRTAVSVLVVRGDTPTGALGVVVPITAPATAAGLLSAEELAVLTRTGGALRDRLDAVAGTDAILAIDPAVVAAIRVLGTTAPASALTWLDDLLALPNSRFALQFGDAGVAAQVGAGGLLEVATLTPYLSPSGFADAGASGASPDPTATPGATDGAPTLPTIAQLTDIGAGAGTIYWPAPGTAGASLVTALADDATSGAGAVTLVDSTAVTTASAPAWAVAAGAPVLVYDASASAALRDAAAASDAVTRGAALASASAYAAIASAADPAAPLLVTIDRPASIVGLREAVLAAERLTGRAAVDLAMLTAGTAAPVDLADIDAPAESVERVRHLVADEAQLTEFSPVLVDPVQLTARERASILQLLGNAWAHSPDEFAAAYAAHRAQTQVTLASVGIVPPSDITLATSGAPLTFSVRNDLPWPIGVVLITTSEDPRLVVQATTAVDGGAAQTSRVRVPVEARVASGEATLTLQLRTTSGMPVGDPVSVHVAVRAEWESVGIVVMAIAIGALIVIGAVRTVLRLRRGRRGADADADADTETGANPAAQPDSGATPEADTPGGGDV
ncbi:MAG: 2-oxoglutarate dehydrogenase [Microbacterium sp.]|nr:MAG: 2-oxoglutarate dehydrogenase [Microbacterium sp.]